MNNIITSKDLRENLAKYSDKVNKGESFIVFKRSRPIFKISPVIDEVWEEVIDFTKIVKGGIKIDDLLARL